MEDKMLPVYTLEEKLLQGLQEYGFKKKRKGYFIRKIQNCIQDVTVLETRIRNKQEVHVTIGIVHFARIVTFFTRIFRQNGKKLSK